MGEYRAAGEITNGSCTNAVDLLLNNRLPVEGQFQQFCNVSRGTLIYVHNYAVGYNRYRFTPEFDGDKLVKDKGRAPA